ncbi:HEAT repeat domain-containing protein [Desulfatiferula olefinivorans]
MTQPVHTLAHEAYVSRISQCITQNDRGTLKDLLDNLPARDKKTQARVLFDISVTEADNAFFALTHLLENPSLTAKLRNDLIDLLLDRSRTHTPFILPVIDHAAPDQLRQATPVLAGILLSETDSHILQKVIAAVGRSGDASCINVVADFIFYDHAELKREAITALGLIGGPSAVKRLAFAAQTSKSDEYLLATLDRLMKQMTLQESPDTLTPSRQFASRKDTLEALAEDSDIAQLLLMLTSASPHDRHLAIDSLIEIGPQAIPAVVSSMDLSNPDRIINGLDILGNIGNEAALPAILTILNHRHPDSNVRFAAYEAISMLPQGHSSVSLVEGITDASEQVRLAAATAIDNNLSDVMIAGLKAKIETSGRQSKRAVIIAAVIDSHAGNIFSGLLDSDAFVFNALAYLSQSHPSTISFFKTILLDRGSRSLAGSIETDGPATPKTARPLTVFCVDDSSICLKYYLRFFHSLGHEPHVFNNPADVLAAIDEKRPDLLTLDLNMLSMNGLQVTEHLRTRYSPDELPIAVITTQEDFIADYRDTAHRTGTLALINHAVQKPLTVKTVKPILAGLS